MDSTDDDLAYVLLSHPLKIPDFENFCILFLSMKHLVFYAASISLDPFDFVESSVCGC